MQSDVGNKIKPPQEIFDANGYYFYNILTYLCYTFYILTYLCYTYLVSRSSSRKGLGAPPQRYSTAKAPPKVAAKAPPKAAAKAAAAKLLLRLLRILRWMRSVFEKKIF
jgi:hypothetical protein